MNEDGLDIVFEQPDASLPEYINALCIAYDMGDRINPMTKQMDTIKKRIMHNSTMLIDKLIQDIYDCEFEGE